MTTEEPGKELLLVQRQALLEEPVGNYHISQQEIDDYDMSFWEMFAASFHQMQRDNPDYEFDVDDHPVIGGISIRWRPIREHRADAGEA